MKAAVITITNHGCSSQWRIKSSRNRRCVYADKSDPGHAAAEAINMSEGEHSYIITGPSSVMDLIPGWVQSK